MPHGAPPSRQPGEHAPQVRSRKSETLSRQAYDRISTALMTGRFRPGEKLTLRSLSKAFEMSSTPIRDAIRQLSAENALDFEPNRHIRVPLLSGDELRELRDIRIALEGMAAERAVSCVDDAAIAELRRLDRQIVRSRDLGDVALTVEGIQALHFFIYRLPGADHLLGLIEGLWLRTAPYVSLLFPTYSQRERGSLRGLIIDAMEARDGKSARRFLEADVCGAMNFIIGQIEEREETAVSPGGATIPDGGTGGVPAPKRLPSAG